MDRGYVKLWRRMLDSKVFSNPEVLKLWIWCLIRANHKTSFVDVGLADPVRVEPGSFITGRYQMHAEYYQKKKRGTRSPLTLWRWLLRLQTWSKLNIKATNRYTLVTLTNWAQYQGVISKNDQPMNSRRTAGEQPVNTDKNDKNDKNDKKETPLPPAGGKAHRQIQKPTIEEIRVYAKSISAGIDAETFWHHYETNGWKVGRNPMKSWKSAVVTWKKRQMAGETNAEYRFTAPA